MLTQVNPARRTMPMTHIPNSGPADTNLGPAVLPGLGGVQRHHPVGGGRTQHVP